MLKSFNLLLFLLVISYQLRCQVQPSDGSTLNYILIGFSFQSPGQVSNCDLEIAKGHYFNEDSFKQNIINTLSCKGNKVIAEVPSFGTEYTWRYRYSEGHSQTIKSRLYHFSTGTFPDVDTTKFRLRILNPARKFKDAYVLIDNNGVMYDMKGHPVWFLPKKVNDSMLPKNSTVPPRDLKLTDRGTMTLLLDEQACEINYNGDILWRAPSSGKVSGEKGYEHYHHEFTRLSNGHYMILGYDNAPWPPEQPSEKETDVHAVSAKKKRPNFLFGTIIEYDDKGNEVWYWKSSQYFKQTDMAYYNTTRLNINEMSDMHENGFYFDEAHKMVYLSFRNINRILKIKYPEGNVVNDYSGWYKADGHSGKRDVLFCQQHCIRRYGKKYLSLYDNNACNTGQAPKVLILQEPGPGKEFLKKIWEYDCAPENDFSKSSTVSGGNVLDIGGNNLFVSMGGEYSKLFIVNKKKEILWAALHEKWNMLTKKWDIVLLYRASIITEPKDMERLIWEGN